MYKLLLLVGYIILRSAIAKKKVIYELCRMFLPTSQTFDNNMFIQVEQKDCDFIPILIPQWSSTEQLFIIN